MPLGLHITGPLGKGDWFNYIGGFISIFDLGSIAFTLADQPANTLTFEQFLSPGAFLTLHINGPLNLFIGASLTPTFLQDPSTISTNDAWRIQAAITFDLTLFSIR